MNCTWCISQLDEKAVRLVTAQKDVVIERLNTQLASKNEDITKLKTDYNTLWEKYKILVLQWNDLTKQPEIIEAVKRVEERKEQEAEAKREEQARQDRCQGILDRFISEGNHLVAPLVVLPNLRIGTEHRSWG